MIPPTYGDIVLAVGRTLLRVCVRVLLKSQLALRLLERFIMSHSFPIALTPLPKRTQTHHRHTQRYGSQLQPSARQPNQTDMGIGVTSYGALGHVPPPGAWTCKKIWQFLR